MGGPRAWRRGPAQLCELFPGCVVGRPRFFFFFLLKSHQAEHLFKKAPGTGREERVKRGGGGGDSDGTGSRPQHQKGRAPPSRTGGREEVTRGNERQ